MLGLLLFSVACTGNFRDYNTDLSGITDDDLIIDDNGYGIRLGIIQQGIYFNYDFGKGKNWPFQLIQNLNADMFGGYMHDGKPLNGGSHNSDYNMQDGWNSAMWTHMYSYIFPQIYQSENATRNTHPALFGITKILKVEADAYLQISFRKQIPYFWVLPVWAETVLLPEILNQQTNE